MRSLIRHILIPALVLAAFALSLTLLPSESYAAPQCNCRLDSDCGSGEVCNNSADCESPLYTGLCEAASEDDGGNITVTGVPTCETNFDSPGNPTGIPTVIGCLPTNAGHIILWVIGKAVIAAGLGAVVLFIIGGYTIATAGGNPDQITEGKSVITAAISGLLFILLSTLLLHIIGVDILGLSNWLY
jgi:hypothetical protein